MTGPRRTYTYPCPDCGREWTVTAAYRARQRQPCLACVRKRNGWQHKPGCRATEDHPGICQVP